MDDVGFIQTVFNPLPALASVTARPTSGVTVPALGFGIRPRGPRILPRRPTMPIMSGVTKHVKINKAFVLDFRHEVGIAHHHCAGLFSRFGCIALGDGNHAHVLPVPLGSTTAPRTCWSA